MITYVQYMVKQRNKYTLNIYTHERNTYIDTDADTLVQYVGTYCTNTNEQINSHEKALIDIASNIHTVIGFILEHICEAVVVM